MARQISGLRLLAASASSSSGSGSSSAYASTIQRGCAVRSASRSWSSSPSDSWSSQSSRLLSATRRSTALVRPADPLPHRGRGQIDRCGDSGWRWHAHGQDLVCPEAQQIHHCRLELTQRSASSSADDHVIATLPAAGTCEQLGRKGRVAAGQATLPKQRRQDQVGISPVGIHRAQRVEGSPTGPIRTTTSPIAGGDWNGHSGTEPRLRFESDAACPVGGSHWFLALGLDLA